MHAIVPQPPSESVFSADDGAPLDHDRVLAVVVRWGERPLQLLHLVPSSSTTMLEGTRISWRENLPTLTNTADAAVWVRRTDGTWAVSGAQTQLQVGERLVLLSQGLTVEARLQRRSEPLPSSRQNEHRFFALLVAHCLMFFVAGAAMLVLTPQVEDDTIWGAIVARSRLVATQTVQLAPRLKPELEERVEAAVKVVQRAPLKMPRHSDAKAVLQRLFAGGGGGVFNAKLGGGIDAALSNLGGGGNQGAAGEGLMGAGARDVGGLGGPGGPGGFGIGGLPMGPGRGGGPPGGLRGHASTVSVCESCLPPLAAGYDRDLILKVVRRRQNEIRFCFESELQHNPTLGGKVTVAWTIGPSGSVEDAQIAESGLGNEAVEKCIVQRVKRWSFPEPNGGQQVDITFPWVFQVAGGE